VPTRGRRDGAVLLPPKRLRLLAGGPTPALFRKIGDDCLEQLRRAGLEPEHDVLDVGCGCGRLAIPLLSYLRGRYDGLDVGAETIAYCRRQIARASPRFRFHHADVAHPAYNPTGSVAAERYRFPDFGPKDFVFLISVFTHLPPPAVAHYLRELARLAARKEGCRIALSLYLYSPRRPRERPRLTRMFDFRGAGFRFDRRSYGFAYEEGRFLRLCRDAGLVPARPVARGDWARGHRGVAPPQDLLVLRRAR